MKTIVKSFVLLGLIIILLPSCINTKFDEPQSICNQINIKPNISIADLKAKIGGRDTMKITEDLIIEGRVISTDQYGNFYKELYIEDSTGGISIMLDLSYMFTKYPLGQKIYVKLKDLYLQNDGGVIKIGNTYNSYGVIKVGRLQGEAFIDQHIIKSCDNQEVNPTVLTIPQVNDNYLGRLVKFNNVEFSENDLGQTWAIGNVDPPQSVNHTLVDADLNQLVVRTSGYAAFANDTIPSGSGYIIGILSKYNNTYQLYIRTKEDAQMNNPRLKLNVFLAKNFDDQDIFSGGWQQKKVSGNVNWEIGTYGGRLYGSISNYSNGQHSACETWYISPKLDLSNATNPILNFNNACNYSGPDLVVKYSTDYDGVSDPSSATWTNLNPTLSTGGWTWTNSGDLALPKAKNVYIAFVYYGSNNDGKTWEIDDIFVKEKQ